MKKISEIVKQRLMYWSVTAKKLMLLCMALSMLFSATSCDAEDIKEEFLKMFKGSDASEQTSGEQISAKQAEAMLIEISDTKLVSEIYDKIYKQNDLLNESGVVDDAKVNRFLNKDYVSAPLAFWESQGYDLDDIASGELDCDTRCFVLDEQPNSLYMATCLINGNEEFDEELYDHFLLRYDLTERDMAEFKLLCGDNGKAHIESRFLPEIISDSYEPTEVFYAQATMGFIRQCPDATTIKRTKYDYLPEVIDDIITDDSPYFEIFCADRPEMNVWQLTEHSGLRRVFLLPVTEHSDVHDNSKIDLTAKGKLTIVIANDAVDLINDDVADVYFLPTKTYKEFAIDKSEFKQYPVTVYTLPGAKYASEYKDYIYANSTNEAGFWVDKEQASALKDMSETVETSEFQPEL